MLSNGVSEAIPQIFLRKQRLKIIQILTRVVRGKAPCQRREVSVG